MGWVGGCRVLGSDLGGVRCLLDVGKEGESSLEFREGVRFRGRNVGLLEFGWYVKLVSGIIF